MKCPKCGYNSFDHLESCKKCGGDLTEHKSRFGLRSLFSGGGTPEPEPAFLDPEETGTDALADEAIAPVETADSGVDFEDRSEADEHPFEASLDDLLGAGESVGTVPDVTSSLVGEGRDDAVSPDADPDLDFSWEEDSAGTGEMAFEEAEPEVLTGSGQEEDFDFGTAPESASPDAFPVSLDFEPASEQLREGIDEFVLENGHIAAPEELSPGTFEPDTAQGDSESARTEPSWEGFGEPMGNPAEPLPESPPADLFPWDDRSEDAEEEPDAPEQNLAELFLDSLDESADPGGALPPFFAGEATFGNIASDVELVERDHLALAEDQDVTENGETPGCETEEDGPAPPESHDAAPLATRIGAGVADQLILAVVFVLFLAAGEVALGPGQNGGFFPSLAVLLQLAVPYFLVLFAVCFGYFTFFHFLLGQTPGKMLFKIRVVGEEGGGLTFSQSFLRSVGGLLSLLPAGLGYLRIPFDRERRGWNDRLANSRVIRQTGWESAEELLEGETEEG